MNIDTVVYALKLGNDIVLPSRDINSLKTNTIVVAGFKETLDTPSTVRLTFARDLGEEAVFYDRSLYYIFRYIDGKGKNTTIFRVEVGPVE